jgi:hypothetical protein
MKIFDPAEERRQLDGDVGYRVVLDFDFEESRNLGGLASSASAYLIDAIYALLVGYDDPAQQLLERAFDWVTIAIKEGERPRDYGPDGTEAQRYETLGMCAWLLHGAHDAESLNRFVEHEERFLVRECLGRDRANVSLTAINYVDAGAYGLALERLASARFSAPKSLNAIRSEGQMCYVICRHRLGLEYTEAEIASATERFLKRNMNTWLLDGVPDRAAQWMKVVHWREGAAGISPKEAVMMCYKYLPDAEPREPGKNVRERKARRTKSTATGR